ncbi:U3 small nucleolar RNA-associated protein 6 [Ancylostoma duodenale]|uniref:U3 small nucleolar RNA-associated protein 6 n=1 Tax=Ancylostoma duodenale TaxID=51022 RepID=A0A0C2H0A9_9BILA|nr:U3 small nucleolar RNA-associated protein 6 [Ancylostoma duodenale]
MGEFVEQSLESLLPTFEQLSHVQLFTESEVNAFVKRCRQFEYRLNKQEKTPRDFDLYAEYLCDFLKLLKSRRTKMQYWHKLKLIDRPMCKKVASIYRRAADRFQGDLHQWEKLINFLNEHTMRRELAAAYTRALQIHGRNENLRREFALWQFFSAASPQNARTQILASLRLFPESAILYSAFFTIEIHFVEKVLKRRKFITEKRGDPKHGSDDSDAERVYDEEVDDSIMNLDVAKAVVEQAISAVSREAVSGMLVEMWKECNKVELVPNIDTVRSFIMGKLKEFDNEDTRLFEIEAACKEGTSKFDAFDVALSKTPTERMHRLYLQWLRESSTRDGFSDMKIRSLLRSICDGDWMTENDWRDLEGCVQEAEEEFDEPFIEKCLEKRPQSAVFWNMYLEKRLKNNVAIDEFRDLCNRALEKIDPEESFPIWQHAIDHCILFAPNEVEQVFYDAMKKANTSVASKVKILFVDYLYQLYEDGKITPEQLKERLMELVNSKPNSGEFYCHVHRKELERSNLDTKFAGFVLKSAVIEECATVEAVILYAKWTMKYDISKFHVVHQTGLKLFKGAELDEFVVKWTQLVQEAAAEAIKNERRVDKAEKKKAVKKLSMKQKKKCFCALNLHTYLIFFSVRQGSCIFV